MGQVQIALADVAFESSNGLAGGIDPKMVAGVHRSTPNGLIFSNGLKCPMNSYETLRDYLHPLHRGEIKEFRLA